MIRRKEGDDKENLKSSQIKSLDVRKTGAVQSIIKNNRQSYDIRVNYESKVRLASNASNPMQYNHLMGTNRRSSNLQET